MKIQLMSDLHLDSYKPDALDHFLKKVRFHKNAEAVVIAGDLSNGNRVIEMLDRILGVIPKGMAKLYVLGNHDNCNHDPTAEIESINVDMFQFMNRKKISLNGKRIVGCTGWFNVNRSIYAQTRDFEMIPGGIDRVENLRKLDVEFLNSALEKTADLVVTHHTPCERSLHNSYWSYREFYNGKFDSLMPQARNWVHGHCHDAVKYKHNGCRVISNPLGYYGQREITDIIKPLTLEI